ncbi:MAG: methylenetetrahydrofolate reductase C-terminal domain-containing protein [Anaerolineae bacterium]|nr:methylenetetrahydrofolate reductase C-terminal domain-containing protein [Anaerolineae bacterium]
MSLRSWLQNHPHLLEVAYDATKRIFVTLDPLWKRIGYERTDRLIRPLEEASKKLVFDCRMCGQCILHSTGMTCSMVCPKNLRNGPCGGVRLNGHCEVIPEMRCVWVEACERSEAMPTYGQEIMLIQPPLNWELQGSSAWVNMLTGVDVKMPAGWSKGEVT